MIQLIHLTFWFPTFLGWGPTLSYWVTGNFVSIQVCNENERDFTWCDS